MTKPRDLTGYEQTVLENAAYFTAVRGMHTELTTAQIINLTAIAKGGIAADLKWDIKNGLVEARAVA